MAVVGGGGQAELAVVHERAAMPVPDELDWTAAGGVPEVFTTAHDALFTQAGLTVGERLLVHGAAGGVGMAAVQLGTMAGARVTATVRNPAAREHISALGVHAIEPEGFEEHGPFDVILELVGAPNMPGNLRALAERGRICVIGVGAGAKVELNLVALMGKRARIHGSVLRARSLEDKAAAARLRGARGAARASPPATSACRSPRRSRSTRSRTPTPASRRAPSSARSCSSPDQAAAGSSSASGSSGVASSGVDRAERRPAGLHRLLQLRVRQACAALLAVLPDRLQGAFLEVHGASLPTDVRPAKRPRAPRLTGRMARLTALLVLLALAVPATAAAQAPPPLRPKTADGPLGDETLSNETTLSRWAYTNLRSKVRVAPGKHKRSFTRLRWDTEDGPPEVYLVLSSRLDAHGKPWLKIRVPGRPNGRTGYVPEQALTPLRIVETQLVVDRKRLEATLYKRGRVIWRSPVGDRRAGDGDAGRPLLDPGAPAQPRWQPGLRPVGLRHLGLLRHADGLARRRRGRHPRDQRAGAHPRPAVARLRARAERQDQPPGPADAGRHAAADQVAQYGGKSAYQSPSRRNAVQNARLALSSSSESSMLGT